MVGIIIFNDRINLEGYPFQWGQEWPNTSAGLPATWLRKVLTPEPPASFPSDLAGGFHGRSAPSKPWVRKDVPIYGWAHRGCSVLTGEFKTVAKFSF